jgi:DNA-binding LytR/AlgR family response regulator
MPDRSAGSDRRPDGLLRVLVVDDELPVREELGFLLARDPRIGTVQRTGSALEALRILERGDVEAVFLDIAMPELSGLDIARVLARFKEPPSVVFVTAHEGHAVEAFEIHAVDYLLKPVREDRLAEAVRRVVDVREGRAPEAPVASADETIPVELGGVTRFVRRSDVRYAEAQGDYVRLHTANGSHLLRTPLTSLEDKWSDAGFVRIHRSLLVAVSHITQVRIDHGRATVSVGDVELQVSRRHTPELRELLLRRETGAGSSLPDSSSAPSLGATVMNGTSD